MPDLAERQSELRVRVMSFNVRFDAPKDAPTHTWANRRASAAEIVRSSAPDVIGLQEVLPHQLADLCADLGGYEFLGRGREAGGGGEHVPLAFLTDRFELDQWGVYWLSELPEVEGSKGWDADNPRTCTWAVLRDRSCHRAFLVANTHLDRWGAIAREESARLLLQRVSRFA